MQVLLVIFSFFAAYGIVQLLVRSVFLFRTDRGRRPICLHRVLGVYNCEDSIEGMVRSMSWGDAREEIIVLELGSQDETPEILRRLSLEDPHLRVMSVNEYAAYLQSLKDDVCVT